LRPLKQIILGELKLSLTKNFAALAFATLATLSFSTHAEDIPKQIQGITQSGAKIIKTFPAASQLKGWVISKDGRYTILFSTPDNQTLLAGDLIDEAGKNLTEQYAELYIPKPDLTPLYSALEHSTFITEGTQQSPKSVIYAFFDPNCPFCHFSWKAFQPYEAAGLQVRWIPVAYLMETSTAKAAAILQAKDRLAAFRENEQKYNLKNHEGGIKPAKPSTASMQQLQANSELMQKLGITGTPAIVWKDAQGKIQMKAGMPRLFELPAITGLPEQTITDPELARFR
jgi:thiol:disulfide interchange protein DsbG